MYRFRQLLNVFAGIAQGAEHRQGLMRRKTRRFRRKLFVLRFRRQGAVRLGEVDDFRKQPLTEGCQGALP